MSNQYQDYGNPPSYGGQDGQSNYGNSDYQSGGGNFNRGGGGGGFNKGGNYGGNSRGGFNKGGGSGADIVTQEDTIFVSGMDPEVTENDINDHFGSIGIIKKDRRTQKPKIWIYRNKETGAGKGECTITYDDPTAASSAIDWFDGKDFNGNKIKVSLAQRNNWQKGGPVKRGGGGGFGGGNRGGFGGDDRPPRNNDDRGPRNFGSGSRDGSGGGGQSREGDWICSGCQNKNFAWRNECNRCKEPKGDDAGGNSRGPPPQRGGFQGRDNRHGGGGGGGGFGRGGGGGGFNRGGPMRGSSGNDRSSGGNRQRPY